MTIFVSGINYKQADLALREQCVVPDHTLSPMLEQLISLPEVEEAMILSTCNRTEITVITQPSFNAEQWLANYFGITIEQFPSYAYQDDEAIKHLIEVACGLDSMVLGETQILGQMKNAFEKAKANNTIGPRLNRLLPFVFNAGKSIRTQNELNRHAGTIPAIIKKISSEQLPIDQAPTVLFIGASNMNRDVAKALAIYNIFPSYWLNRSFEKSVFFAEQLGGQAIRWDQLTAHLQDIDIIISATKCDQYILSTEQIAADTITKTCLCFDLAVPRDIDPDIVETNHIQLFQLDDLQQQLQHGQGIREEAAKQAKQTIQKFLNAFKIDQTHQEHAVLITNYRAQAEQLRLFALDNAIAQLEKGANPIEVCKQLSIQLTSRLLHHPTLGLRDMITRSDEATIACLAARLEKQNEKLSD